MNDFLREIHLGTCYYPDHWEKDRWQKDIDDILAMGADVARVAELSWAAMEPRDGEFDFSWLDEFLDMAAKSGLKIILGTPSEATPVWLRNEHPDIVRVDEFGRTHGGRGLHCHNSKTFRFYIDRMTEKMAERYGAHPAVVGWQIDNEFRATDCYCGECLSAFKKYLIDRYHTVENLNAAWGTCTWSQHYNTFEEVRLPGKDQVTISTSQVLDYKRFASLSTVRFQKSQIDIIKKHAPGQFVTHNSLGLYPHLNMYDLAQDLDIMGWDLYPDVDDDYVSCAFCHDLMRASKHAPYCIPEQKNGYFNYSDYNLAITPGLVRAWTFLDIARGANDVLFYRYRANRFGQEQNPNGILRHDGSKRRAYYEIQDAALALAPIRQSLADTNVCPRVALIHHYDDMWSAMAKKQYANFDCVKLEMEFYRALLSLGVTVDVVPPTEDFSRYSVVIAPNLMLLDRPVADNLTAFAENGGTLILHIRCGTKEIDNAVIDAPWPGLMRRAAGVTVEEFEAFPDHIRNTVIYKDQPYEIKWWADIMTADTAQVKAVYGDRFYKGTPAITENKFGKGTVSYFAPAGCPELTANYLEDVLRAASVPTERTPERLYKTVREGAGGSFAFAVNMGAEARVIAPPFVGYDYARACRADAPFTLQPLEVSLIKAD